MCQLAFWREHARFPEVEADIAPAVIEHIARRIGVPADAIEGYDFAGALGSSSSAYGPGPSRGARLRWGDGSRFPNLVAR
jgi:hypothetical protein